MPTISCSTAYLHTGIGLIGRKLGRIKEIAHYARATARPGIIAGDFNAEPLALRGINLLREVGGTLFVPAHNVATCTAGKRHSVIDLRNFLWRDGRMRGVGPGAARHVHPHPQASQFPLPSETPAAQNEDNKNSASAAQVCSGWSTLATSCG